MKIFITGICGFLGSHLARAASKDGHLVSGCDTLIGGDFENLEGVELANFKQLDCRDTQALSDLMKIAKPDVVYHTAAYPHEGLSVFSPALIGSSVYTGSVSTMSAAIQAGVKRVINMSSMARYGTQSSTPFYEWMTPKPQDPYGIAKVAAEDTMRLLANVHGVEFINCIPHNITGPGQRFTDPFRNVAAIMVNRVLRGLPPIVYGDGEQRRCFSHVFDDVPVMLAMANLDRKDIVGENFNVGPDEEFVTIKELAKRVIALCKSGVEPVHMAARPQEVKDANCSASKIRRVFNYSTRYSLDDILTDLIDDIRARGPREFTYHLAIEIQSPLTPRVWRERIL